MGTMCQSILEDRGLMPTVRLHKAILRERKKILESQQMLDQLQKELGKRTREDAEILARRTPQPKQKEAGE